LWAILAVFVARFIVVYGLSWLVKHVAEPIPLKWQHILNWGDMRGAVSLALALSLPLTMGAERELLGVMTFGVVLFTLLVQSTTMTPLVRWLKIVTRSDAQIEYELQHARLTALRSADSHLDHLHNDGMLSSHTWEKLKRNLTIQAVSLAEKVRGMLIADPVLEAEELDTGWREMLRAQRASLLSLRQDGVISDEVFERLSTEVDAQLSEGYSSEPDASETRTQFLEVTLTAASAAIGKTIAELSIPRAAVLVSIQRGNETIIPRGDTILHVGDRITTLCERDAIPSVKRLLLASDEIENNNIEDNNPVKSEAVDD
jgi:NhaP-type Na+/H+ or K+/H+ antiporter